MKRIPTLDGWRGIAILLVIVSHAQSGILGHAWRYRWMDLGQHGVGIFMVLSGYLITSRLLVDDQPLFSFYVRRFFRLMPVAWVYLAILPVAGMLLHMRVIGDEVWGCVLFFRNCIAENNHNALTSHFWSLSLEEQFYIAWPCILMGLGKRKALVLAVLGAGACAGFRMLHWEQALSARVTPGIRVDALLVGCAMGILLESEAIRGFVERHSTALLVCGAGLFLQCVYSFQAFPPLRESVAVAVVLTATSLAPAHLVSRALEYRHLKMLGVISYSVYVWQELLLLLHWGFIGVEVLIPVSIASYALIERPGMALGKRVGVWMESGAWRQSVAALRASESAEAWRSMFRYRAEFPRFDW
ncbi:MAG: acyltransferase [Acidobacteriota bacterium]